MADVSAAMKDWSATSSSNSPSGSTNIGTSLDDNLREIQGSVVRNLHNKGADIASATTTDLGAVEGLFHDITGTTTITGFGTVRAGVWKVIKFEGVLTLTHNATSLILPGGANITTADGDVAIVTSEGSGNWRCDSYTKANGRAVVSGITLGTAQASTSGTSIDFTGIPSGTKRITIMFVGVSTSGSSNQIVQLGDGAIEATGYLGAVMGAANGGTGEGANFTTGFGVTGSIAAGSIIHGSMTIDLENAASFTWVSRMNYGRSDAAHAAVGGGSKSLSSELDRVRITTVGGTETFDAGAINISYEG